MLYDIGEIKFCLELAGQSYDAYRVRQSRPSIEGGKKEEEKTRAVAEKTCTMNV